MAPVMQTGAVFCRRPYTCRCTKLMRGGLRRRVGWRRSVRRRAGGRRRRARGRRGARRRNRRRRGHVRRRRRAYIVRRGIGAELTRPMPITERHRYHHHQKNRGGDPSPSRAGRTGIRVKLRVTPERVVRVVIAIVRHGWVSLHRWVWSVTLGRRRTFRCRRRNTRSAVLACVRNRRLVPCHRNNFAMRSGRWLATAPQ